MTFLDFFKCVITFFGSGGAYVIAFVVLLVGLGVYKFVKDWLPW